MSTSSPIITPLLPDGFVEEFLNQIHDPVNQQLFKSLFDRETLVQSTPTTDCDTTSSTETNSTHNVENLCLSYSTLKKAHFKYLALHCSNHIFPCLKNLDVSNLNLDDSNDSNDSNDDDDDNNSTMHYMLQWIGASMPNLTSLNLGSCRLTTQSITTDLANSPILSRLESLDLSSNSTVKAEGWQTLFTSPQFTTTKLKSLVMNNNPRLKAAIPVLAQDCPHLTNLTTLSLNGCVLDNHSIQSICDSKWIHGLESLLVEYNNGLTSAIIPMITNCEGMKNLSSLMLGRRPGQFSVDLLRHITQSQHVTKLKQIEIDFTGISYDHTIDQLLRDFFHSSKASSLTDLSLYCANNIPQSTVKSVMLSPLLSNVETLRVYGPCQSDTETPGNDEWIGEFVSSANRHKLEACILRQLNLTDANVLSMSQSPHLSNLRRLEISHNPALTDDSMKYLVESEVLRLERLYFNNNPLLTSLIFHHLASFPRTLSSLELLSLIGSPLLGNEHRDILSNKVGQFDCKILI